MKINNFGTVFDMCFFTIKKKPHKFDLRHFDTQGIYNIKKQIKIQYTANMDVI